MVTETQILQMLKKQQLQLPPANISFVKKPASAASRIDAIVQASWGRKRWRFAAEVKRLSTPLIIQEAIGAIEPGAKQMGMNPMIIVPYLSPPTIALLESKCVSGLDLCGNGIITVPSETLILRTGNPNRFPQSATIRNVFRGDSSLVARAFFLRNQYRSLREIETAIQANDGAVTLSTISKVLKTLQDELIVARKDNSIQLIQADKLLEELAANYRPPKAMSRWIGRIELPENEIQVALAKSAIKAGSRFILTGAASAGQYAVQAREPVVAAYCSCPPEDLLAAIPAPAVQTDRFPNVDLTETIETPVYFEPMTRNSVPYASPIQTYVELASGDKRQRETAEQVRAYILNRAKQ